MLAEAESTSFSSIFEQKASRRCEAPWEGSWRLSSIVSLRVCIEMYRAMWSQRAASGACVGL